MLNKQIPTIIGILIFAGVVGAIFFLFDLEEDVLFKESENFVVEEREDILIDEENKETEDVVEESDSETDKENSDEVNGKTEISKKDDNDTEKKSVSVEELASFSSRQADFSFSIFNEILKERKKGNIFISPYSIHTALLLTYIGSEKETREEMREVLVLLGMSDKEIVEKARDLKKYLENISETTEIAIANALFLRKDIPFLPHYKKEAEEYFEAKIDVLPLTRKPINEWIKKSTRGKIGGDDHDDFDEKIPPGTIAYLINAIYFKGIWEIEFDVENTAMRTFYGKEEREIEMMKEKNDYSFYFSEDLKAVTLEYKDGDYLFHAFLPSKESSLSSFYNNLGREKIKEIKDNMIKEEVVIKMPKFKLKDELKLKGFFKSLGMENAFSRESANFTRMVDEQFLMQASSNVFISEISHSSFIEIDEKGTEAAAITEVDMGIVSAPMVIEFNRPFFFMIEEAETESILFMGQFKGQAFD